MCLLFAPTTRDSSKSVPVLQLLNTAQLLHRAAQVQGHLQARNPTRLPPQTYQALLTAACALIDVGADGTSVALAAAGASDSTPPAAGNSSAGRSSAAVGAKAAVVQEKSVWAQIKSMLMQMLSALWILFGLNFLHSNPFLGASKGGDGSSQAAVSGARAGAAAAAAAGAGKKAAPPRVPSRVPSTPVPLSPFGRARCHAGVGLLTSLLVLGDASDATAAAAGGEDSADEDTDEADALNEARALAVPSADVVRVVRVLRSMLLAAGSSAEEALQPVPAAAADAAAGALSEVRRLQNDAVAAASQLVQRYAKIVWFGQRCRGCAQAALLAQARAVPCRAGSRASGACICMRASHRAAANAHTLSPCAVPGLFIITRALCGFRFGASAVNAAMDEDGSGAGARPGGRKARPTSLLHALGDLAGS